MFKFFPNGFMILIIVCTFSDLIRTLPNKVSVKIEKGLLSNLLIS